MRLLLFSAKSNPADAPGGSHLPSRARLLLHISAGVITALMLLPLLYLLLRAAGVGPGALELILRPRTGQVIWNSGVLTLGVTGLSLLIALPLAWLTVRTDLPGRKLWTVLLTLPLVIPSYVGGFALVAMMGPKGILQSWLAPLGVERLPSIYGLPGALWALTLFTYPYLFLSIRAGLRNQDPALEEAANSLGHSRWVTFWRVTLPTLRPAITSGALLVALYTLSDFGAVSLLRFNSFTRAIYVQYLSSFDRSLAALLSLILVLMTVALLYSERAVQGRARYYRSSAGSNRQSREMRLGRWRIPALLLVIGVVAAALLVPVGVVTYWLVQGIHAGESFAPMWRATLNTVQAGMLAALAATLLALPVAYLSSRFPSVYAALISQAAYIGYGLPGIVVALSLVFFGANYATFFYQTLGMLVFAYVVRYMPQAMGVLRTNLLQTSPRLEEAARGLGLNRRQVLGRVTLPLLRPGILAGAALVFLTTIKELPATLLLGPTGFTTLATQIWSATEEAFFARAAAPALLLLVVSATSIVIILGQEKK